MDIIVFIIRSIVVLLVGGLGITTMISNYPVTKDTAPVIVLMIISDRITGAILVAAATVALFI